MLICCLSMYNMTIEVGLNFNFKQGVLSLEKVLDLDVQVKANNNSNDSAGDERITSHSLCTPGCAKTGSFNSFCC